MGDIVITPPFIVVPKRKMRGTEIAKSEPFNARANLAEAIIGNLKVTTAKINDLAVTNAKINDLNAVKITAGDIAAARLTVQAANAVNSGSVVISPDKISILGKLIDDLDNSTYAKVLATDDSAGHLKLTSSAVKDAEWYDESGVEIDASHGINIYGVDNAFTTRATKTGTIQCKVDTAGAILAGAGAVVLDADGLNLSDFAKATGIGFTRYAYQGIQWFTIFESLDGFLVAVTGTGAITLDSHSVLLATGATINSTCQLEKYASYSIIDPTWSKKRRFKTRIYFGHDTTQTIWIISGHPDAAEHIGFKVVNGTLYKTVADGATENPVDTGVTITAGNIVLLEAVFITATSCEFFVNGVSKGTLTANLPTGDLFASSMLFVYLTNTAAVSRSLRVSQWSFIQEP